MSLVLFESLPDTSRLWIFSADRELAGIESSEFLQAVDKFLETWQAHGAPVESGRELRYNHFLFVAANEDVTHPSGCSIDALTREIQAIGVKLGVSLLNPAKVYYRDGGSVVMVDRLQFKELAAGGVVDKSTMVFNNAITTLGELRAGKWEVSANHSWHADTFKMREPLNFEA